MDYKNDDSKRILPKMTAAERSCANCCARDPVDGECMNGMGARGPEYWCEEHKTWDQNRADDEAIQRFFAAIGIGPKTRPA